MQNPIALLDRLPPLIEGSLESDLPQDLVTGPPIPVLAADGLVGAYRGVFASDAVHRTARSFERALGGATVAVVFLQSLDHAMLGSLGDVCRRHPLCAFLCVIPGEPEFVRAIHLLPFAEVLLVKEGPSELVSMLQCYRGGGVDSAMHAVVVRADRLSPWPRTALRHLFSLNRPLTSTVAALAQRLGCSESTLRTSWAADFPEWKLTHVVRLARLLRALRQARMGMTAVEVAVRLGIHERTLHRNSLALTGRSFAENATEPGIRATIKQLVGEAEKGRATRGKMLDLSRNR